MSMMMVNNDGDDFYHDILNEMIDHKIASPKTYLHKSSLK